MPRPSFRSFALGVKLDYDPLKTRQGWYDHFRKADRKLYREIWKLVSDYEAGDAELLARWPKRKQFLRAVIRPTLLASKIDIGVGALEGYARMVREDDRRVRP